VVTKGLAESVKTRLVDYDEDALRTSGTAIILSPRRYRPDAMSPTEKKPNPDQRPFVSGL